MTVMRLPKGEWVIHSGAPLTKTDVGAVRALGEPAWLLEGSRMHDTFGGRLRQAFPETTYLLSPRFPLKSQDLAPARRLKTAELPAAGRDEIEIVRVAGIPAIEEHVLWHRRSKTLVVSDLVFNLGWPPEQRVPWFLRWVSGIKSIPATSRLVKLATKNRDAARKSIERILEWEIARVVVGHGAVMETNARDLLKRTLNWLITDQV
jgi:hypothetical protein